MTNTTKDDMTELAELAYDAIRPAYGNDKPYAIERVFRESVKAVKTRTSFRLSADEAALLVAGRLENSTSEANRCGRYPPRRVGAATS